MISIIIPTYEYGGHASWFLRRLFDSIRTQTYGNYEVIVVDHSQDDAIMTECGIAPVEVIYTRNKVGIGNSSANMNLGLTLARGHIMKIMHLDDFFFSNLALENIARVVEGPGAPKWGVMGFCHFLDSDPTPLRPIIPSLVTTLGCPSVSFFVRNPSSPDKFDEHLTVINDHDFHQNLLFKYGRPSIVPELCIGIGTSSHQYSNNLQSGRQDLESRFFLHKRNLFILNLAREIRLSGAPEIEFDYVNSKEFLNKANHIRDTLRNLLNINQKFLMQRFFERTEPAKREVFQSMEYVEIKSGMLPDQFQVRYTP